METLLDYPSKKVEYKGKKYRVNTAYDTVLLIQCIYEEENFNSCEKIQQALKLFVYNHFKVWLLKEGEKAELLEKITKEQIEMPKRPQSGVQKKLMDFRRDGDYIYSSFMQAYGMDLIKERGHLPWRRFIDLFDGLPEKTKIKEVMKIRAMELPQPTKYNQKEIQNILELKAHYALPVKDSSGKKELDVLFSTLEGMTQSG